MARPAGFPVLNPFPAPNSGWAVLFVEKQILRASLLHASQMQMFPAGLKSPGIHSHPVFHFVLPLKGQGSFTIGGERITVRPRDLIFVDPDVTHSFQSQPEEDLVYAQATLQFRRRNGKLWDGSWPRLLNGLCGRDPDEPLPSRVSSRLSLEITECIGRMIACFSDGSGAVLLDIEVNGLLARLSQLLLNRPMPEQEPAIAKVHDAIIAAGFAQVDLKLLASSVNRTANYVSRAFKSRYGMAPVAFQNQRRMAAARMLLETTDYPLKQIAEMTGFRSTQSFWRYFQRMEGRSPGSLRRG